MNSKYAPIKNSYREWQNNKAGFDDFVLTLMPEDKILLLKDDDFRQFLKTKLETPEWFQFLSYLSTEEFKTLFDNKFIDLISSELTSEIFAQLYDKLDNVELNYLLSFDSSLIDLYSISICFEKLNENLQFKIVQMVLNFEDLQCVDLSDMLDKFYPARYKSEFLFDYSLNVKHVQFMGEQLKNKKIANIFLKDKGLIVSLDPENRYNLYSQVNFDDLDKRDIKIIEHLLYNAEMCNTKLPDNILLNEKFIKLIANKKDWGEYKQILLSIKDINAQSYKLIKNERNKIADLYIDEFKNKDYNELNQSDNTDIYCNNFVDTIFQRYFSSYASDVYMSACVLQDAINTMPQFKSRISAEGQELIQRLVVMFLQQTQYGFDKEDVKKMGELTRQNIYNIKSVITLLGERDDWGEMFKKALVLARKDFAKNLSNTLYNPTKAPVKEIDGIKVYDITKVENFHLLVHDQTIYEFNKSALFKELPENVTGQNISMSLLDNNHLKTFNEKDDANVTFGYADLEDDAIQHALPTDSFTNYCANNSQYVSKRSVQAVTDYLPSYIDIDSFMGETLAFNEIKVQARANAVNNRGNKVFKAKYILCKNVITELDKHISKVYNLPIVFINTNEVIKQPIKDVYTPIIKKVTGGYTKLKVKDSNILK